MLSNNILENETIDDLQLLGMKIIQKKDGFKFGTDAVLLSDFSKDIYSERTLDLCTGTGIVAFLLHAKSRTKRFDAIEIQEDIADMARRSVEINKLCDDIKITCADLLDAVKIYGKRQFDLVTCNPPYIRSGVMNKTDSKTISRHEVKCTLEDIIRISSEVMKTTARLAMVHRPTRIAELLYYMKKYKIEPKRIRFVHKSPDTEPVLVLVEGMYGAKSDCIVMPPLILYDNEMNMTDELKKIYDFLE